MIRRRDVERNKVCLLYTSLMAVLEKRANLSLSDCDAYVNIAGTTRDAIDTAIKYDGKAVSYTHLEIMTADYYTLLRVPGIGTNSVRRIIKARKHAKLSFTDLKKMGVDVYKRQQQCTLKTSYK